MEVAHSRPLRVIAEHAETEEQLEHLRRVRCQGVQGYLFSSIPVTQVPERILALNQLRSVLQESWLRLPRQVTHVEDFWRADNPCRQPRIGPDKYRELLTSIRPC